MESEDNFIEECVYTVQCPECGTDMGHDKLDEIPTIPCEVCVSESTGHQANLIRYYYELRGSNDRLQALADLVPGLVGELEKTINLLEPIRAKYIVEDSVPPENIFKLEGFKQTLDEAHKVLDATKVTINETVATGQPKSLPQGSE